MIGRRHISIGMGIGLGVVIAIGAAVQLGLITADVTTIASLNAGILGTEPGQVLDWSGSTWQLDRADSPLLAESWREEFKGGSTALYATNCSVAGNFTGNASGTSACGYNNADTIRGGTVSLTTSTGATDGIRMAAQANSVVFGTVPQRVICLWKIHNLSDANTQYKDACGFTEPTSNARPVDGVFAEYDFATNGGVSKWTLVTTQNSNVTVTTCTGSTGDISADTWYKLQVDVTAAGVATLTINGNVCASTSTNVPNGTARGTSVGLQHFNATGAVPIAQLSFVDLVWQVTNFPVAR